MSRRDDALWDELRQLAERLGVKVREEILLREVGYRVRSGACRVRGEDVIFVDRHLGASERIDLLVQALDGRDIELHYLSPALRRLFERRGGVAA